MTPLTINRSALLSLLLFFAGLTRGLAQYSISGAVNVIAGVNYAPYTIGGGTTSTADKWCATNGTLNSTSNTCVNNNGTPNVSVTWTSAGSGSLTYTLNGTGNPVATLAVTVYAVSNIINSNPNAEFAPDYYPFVPLNQAYTLNLQGSAVTIPPANVTYSWQESLDGTHYTTLPNSNTQYYVLSQEFTQANTWIERVVSVNLNGQNYISTSSPIIVQTTAPVFGGSITPTSLSIAPGGNPGTFTGTAATGGTNCNGTYTYTWQTSTDNVNWTNAGSGLTFAPGVLSTTTYIRLSAYCGPIAGVSNTAVVTVYNNPLQPGLISPMNIEIASGTDPGNLTGSQAYGGDVVAGYVYTWYFSTNNGFTWNPISPAVHSQNYDPGVLTATTQYMRQVSCNGVTANSNVAIIQVGTVASPNSIQSRAIVAGGITSYSAAAALTALTDVHQTTQYFDDLGRLTQTVTKQGSLVGSTATDLIKPVQYDVNGHDVFNYLPYPSGSNNGGFDPNALPDQNAANATLFKAQGDNFYYGQTNYEPSPLARVNGVTPEGDNWTGANRGTQTLFTTNTAIDQVYAWNVTNSGTSGVFGTYTFGYLYQPGTLTKTIATDENGHQVITFKDLDGNLLLKKVQLTAVPDDGTGSGYTGWLCTYYIYDIWNNLRCVVQPHGVQLLIQNQWNFSALGGAILDQQCFRYEYDARNRITMRQVPGPQPAQPEYLVHDNLDRLVMTQNGNQRQNGQWQVTIYESTLDRPVATGIWTNSPLTFATALSGAYSATTYPFALANMPSSGWDLLTQTHYDNYTSIPAGVSGTLNTSALTMANFISSYNTSPTYAQPLTQITPTTAISTLGLVCWTEAEVLGASGGTGQYIVESKIYDNRTRVIQEQTYNYTGGLDLHTTQYNFLGVPLIEDMRQQEAITGYAQSYEVATRYTYDALVRPVKVEKEVIAPVITSPQWKTISTFAYDAIGRMVTKTLGTNPVTPSSPLETQTYEYNVRGWTLGLNRSAINSTAPTPYFGYELGYDKANTIVPGTTYSGQQYNGNIGGTVWKNAGDQLIKKYDFNYDAANRLYAASPTNPANYTIYTGGSFNTNAGLNFSISSIAFDANGNLTQLSQYGWKNGTSSVIDALTYNYSNSNYSNQLLNVQDLSSDQNTTLGDFHYSPTYTTALNSSGGKTTTTQDYSYDYNGNLTVDKNKDITNVSYNYLDLPRTYTVAGNTSNGTVTYTYDANGRKLAKQVVETGAVVNGVSTTITTTTTYLAGFVYQSVNYSNSTLSSLNYSYNLQYFNDGEGRVRVQYNSAVSLTAQTGMVFDYYLKDHLDNTRAVVTEEQETNTYPTLSFEGTTSAAVANQNATWDNASGTMVDVLNNRTSSLPVGFQSAPYGTYCNSISRTTSATPIGAAKLIRVMAGDQLTASVAVTYSSATADNSAANGLNTLVNSLANMILGSASNVNSAMEGSAMANAAASSQGSSTIVKNIFNTTWNELPQSTNVPQAYLHVLLFNDQFVFDNANSMVYPMSSVALNAPQILQTNTPINISKNGYAYIYFSNESKTVVYFDNFNLNHIRGQLVETNDYYPFGLSMAATSGMAMKSPYAPNKLRYNGKELQNQEFSNGSGLEETDYGARFQDPQLGRFMVRDKFAESFFPLSPYQYAGNNPYNFADANGDYITIDKSNANGIMLSLLYEDGKAYYYSKDKDGNIVKGKEWDGKDDFILHAINDLNMVSSTKMGATVVNDLVRSKNPLNIGSAPDIDGTAFTSADKSKTGRNTIAYTQKGGEVDWVEAYSYDALGHELYHAWAYEFTNESHETDFGHQLQREKAAVDFEDYLRAKFGERKLRTQYTIGLNHESAGTEDVDEALRYKLPKPNYIKVTVADDRKMPPGVDASGVKTTPRLIFTDTRKQKLQ